LREKRKWKKLDLLKKLLELRWSKELKLSGWKEKRKLKNTDLNKNASDRNTRLEWKLRD